MSDEERMDELSGEENDSESDMETKENDEVDLETMTPEQLSDFKPSLGRWGC